MAMKLLPKSEIDRQKAVEQKTAIDEGLKVARRVDDLRKLAAEEEQSLETFRQVTVAKIHEETTKATTERDEVKREVATLKEERAELQKPLDGAWAAYHKSDAELNTLREEVIKKESVLAGKQREAEQTSKEAISVLARAKTREELANMRLYDADTDATRAEEARKDAQVLKEQAQVVKQEADKQFAHREKVVVDAEASVMIRETDLATREKELTDGWRLLKDREALFERNLKRK